MAEASLRDFVASVTEDIPTEDLALILMSSDISVAIIRKRVDMGMTQKEFSEYMGVSQAMVSKWESGCANFTLKTLAQIAAKLDVQVRSPFVVDHTPAHLKHRTYDHDNVVQFPNAASWEFSSSGSTFTDVGELKEM